MSDDERNTSTRATKNNRSIDRTERVENSLGVTKGQESFYRAAIEEWNIWGMEEEEEEE